MKLTKGNKTNTACRVCGNKDLKLLLDLGKQPPANAFVTSKQIRDLGEGYEKVFPLRVYFCPNCSLVQLLDIVNPDILFKDYAYFTGKSSQTMKQHFNELAMKLAAQYLEKGDLVIDIGGNDGTFLSCFTDDIKTINVEPSKNVAMESVKKNITTITDFFNISTAHNILNEERGGKAKIITATNVFAHVDNLHEFMAGVKLLLKPEGVFIIEVPHLLHLILNNEFDTIYHEHLSYFSLSPLIKLGDIFNLPLFKVEKIPVHGGSIRCYFGNYAKDKSILSVLNEEREGGLFDLKTYKEFAKKVEEIKNALYTLLVALKKENKRIVGYGAPAKGNTLLNYCGIGPELLDYITDTTPYKQGRYSPGMHIPVVSPDKFHEDPPDYALMLPWNFKEEILVKEKDFLMNGGKWIIPIPSVRVITKDDKRGLNPR